MGTRANSPCVSRINTTRASIGGRTFHREMENMEVENRLSDEFKFVNLKSDSLFQGEIVLCENIISQICSIYIICGSDQCPKHYCNYFFTIF